MENAHAYYAEPSRFDRLRWWLFPSRPMPRLENDERTYLTTHVHLGLDWKDRLRVLTTGRVHVQVTTYTDVLVNTAQSVSNFAVEP